MPQPVLNNYKIELINKVYKENHRTIDATNLIMLINKKIGLDIKNYKNINAEIIKQHSKKQGLQAGIIAECSVVETISRIFGLNHFVDIDDNNQSIPIKILKLFINFKENTDIVLPRYFYYNDTMDTLIVQYGNCKTIDAMFVTDNDSIRLEIKQVPAKLEEKDINKYDEDGKLVVNDEFQNNNKVYLPFIKIFNDNTNIFNEIGKNFKISNFLNDDNLHQIIEQVLNNKQIDIFLFLTDTKIYPILPDHLIWNISFIGSEIRTSGRNATTVFTKKYFLDVLNNVGGYIKNNIVYIPETMVKKTIGRGKAEATRININEFFYIDIKKVSYFNNYVAARIKDIRQKKPTISIHLNSSFNELDIISQLDEN